MAASVANVDDDERGGERRRADERPIAIAGTAARAAPPHERRARVGHRREVNVVAAHRAIPAAVAIGGADQACARSRHEQGRCAGTADDAAVGEDLRASVDRAAAATRAGARPQAHASTNTMAQVRIGDPPRQSDTAAAGRQASAAPASLQRY